MFKRNKSTVPQKQKKGQSTVEYVILVAAVLTAILIFLAPNGIFHSAVNSTLEDGTDTMMNMSGRLQGSHP
jgi:uncharacterized protein (UPF0333 family)